MEKIMFLNATVTDCKNLFDKSPSTTSLEQFLMDVQSCKYQDLIKKVRGAYEKFEISKSDKDKKQYEKFKNKLPTIRVVGVFESIGADSFDTNSNTSLKIIDIDGITSDTDALDDIKVKLASDEHTLFVFTSPTGNGLKVGIALKYDHSTEKYNQDAFVEYYKKNFDLDICQNALPWHKHCFYSCDENVFVNQESEVTPFDCTKYAPKKVKKSKKVQAKKSAPITTDSPVEVCPHKELMMNNLKDILNSCGPTDRHNKVHDVGIKVGFGLKSGMYSDVEYDFFRKIVQRVAPGHENTYEDGKNYGFENYEGVKYIPFKTGKGLDDTVVDIDYSVPVLWETPAERWEREKKWRKAEASMLVSTNNKLYIDDEAIRSYYKSLPIASDADVCNKKIRKWFHILENSVVAFGSDDNISDVIYNYMIEDGVPAMTAKIIKGKYTKYLGWFFLEIFRKITIPKKEVNKYYFRNVSVKVFPEMVEIKPIDSRLFAGGYINKNFYYLAHTKVMQKQFIQYNEGICMNKVGKEFTTLNEAKLIYLYHIYGVYMSTSHSNFDSANKRILWLIDDGVARNLGGTGKSLFADVLMTIQPGHVIKGRKTRTDFLFSGYEPELHDAIHFDDVKNKDIIEELMSSAGKTVEIEKKGRNVMNLVEETEKFNITVSSNFLPENIFAKENHSYRRRITIFPMSGFWRSTKPNQKKLYDTGFLLWEDDSEQWNILFNDLIFLLQEYLKDRNPVFEYDEVAVEKEVKAYMAKPRVNEYIEMFFEVYDGFSKGKTHLKVVRSVEIYKEWKDFVRGTGAAELKYKEFLDDMTTHFAINHKILVTKSKNNKMIYLDKQV